MVPDARETRLEPDATCAWYGEREARKAGRMPIMMTRLSQACCILSLLLAAGLAQARGGILWLHIRVTDAASDKDRVNVNLPLSLADMALDLLDDPNIKSGRVRLDGREVSLVRIRQVWSELRKLGDGELLTVKEGEQVVSLWRVGAGIRLETREGGGGSRKLQLEVPVRLVDALLAGDGESLDVRGALDELKEGPRGEILKLTDEDGGRVRVWID